MKKTITISLLILVSIFGPSASLIKDNNGKAGYTGSPGEITCSGGGSCHGGGTSTAKGVTITATPSFTTNQYMADSLYVISVQASAAGFNWYGFDCEILDSLSINSGTMQGAGAGVKFLTSGGNRRNATHTTPKNGTGGTTFNFQWKAPSSGAVNFYVYCNAVNHNGSTSGDLPMPGTLQLYPVPMPPQDTTVIDTTDIRELSTNLVAKFNVYPNPLNDYATFSYDLKETEIITIDLLNIEGSKLAELFSAKQRPGSYSQFLKVPEVPAGVYFIRISAKGEKVSQKMVTIR
ncbi:MAG: T9SS type A sorting domain-containing protein [bacterium]|nr:T9SS type A sorting domain-containing protein [bacterium]